MKNNKLFIVLIFLVLNSFVKAMDFDESLVKETEEQEEISSGVTFAEKVAYTAAVASAYREEPEEETKTVFEEPSAEENLSSRKKQKTFHSSADKAMDFYGFLEDSDDANKIDFDSIDSIGFEINSYAYELSQKKLQNKSDSSTKELRQKDPVLHNSTSLTKKVAQEKKSSILCTYADCGKSFTLKGNLKQHINSVHKGKRYTCTYKGCNKSFGYKSNFNQHIDLVHTGKKHTCTHDGCDKQFNSEAKLKNHIKLHDRDGYECTYDGCNKSFTQQQNLIKHIKSIHEGVRYPCSECNKTFSTKGNLKAHFDKQHG